MNRNCKGYHSLSCPVTTCDECSVYELLLSAFAERDNSQKNVNIVGAILGERLGEICIERVCRKHDLPPLAIADWIVKTMAGYSEEAFLRIVEEMPVGAAFEKGDVPQISSFDEVLNASTIVAQTGEAYTFEQLGAMLENATGGHRGHYAKIKYGENQAKFAAMMGLVNIRKDATNHFVVSKSLLGLSLFMLDDANMRQNLIRRLIFRNRMFRNVFFMHDTAKKKSVEDGLNLLEQSTRLRRFRTLRALVRAYCAFGGNPKYITKELAAWLNG